MENPNREKQRAYNTIWNASEDYSFIPDFDGYNTQGLAELYWNYIVGATHKYYDYPILQQFFASLKKDPEHAFYENLVWIGLENCVFRKGIKDRPVLESLRNDYSRKVVNRQIAPSYYFLIDEINLAHYHRILGNEQNTRERVSRILNELEFDESLNTEQIISKLCEIIDTYFALSNPRYGRNLLSAIFSSKTKLKFGNPFLKLHKTRVRASSSKTESLEKKEKKNKDKNRSFWSNFVEYTNRKSRENINHLYGNSILTESQTQNLERVLCVEKHQNCHLHFTRGEFDSKTVARSESIFRANAALSQRQKNRDSYNENITRNTNNIIKLTNILKNTLLVDLESTSRSEAGKLIAGRIWRNLFLNDSKIFLRNRIDEIGNITVDILLDASGSQMNRQESIAEQGYMIAESLTRCQIPTRVYSFCTNSSFTVINLFRDYLETNKNEQIFNYHSSGCNRDGLAIRTALHMMRESPCEHKILIVLSDGKPIDPSGFTTGVLKPEKNCYSDEAGVNDTALEVRKGRQHGYTILCVYTGLEEDFPAARKIYGNNLVFIKSPEKFAHMVGILIRNELRNL